MNISLLKKPGAWAIIVPVLLMFGTVSATLKMFSQRDKARNQWELTTKVQKDARQIIALLNQSGRGDLTGAALPHFQDKTSARLCAEVAGIPLSRLTRGESGGKPKKEKDGRILHRENYKLNRVPLLQIAQFVDYAERNFSSLSCTQLTLTSLMGEKDSDAWDATVSLQYFTSE